MMVCFSYQALAQQFMFSVEQTVAFVIRLTDKYVNSKFLLNKTNVEECLSSCTAIQQLLSPDYHDWLYLVSVCLESISR